MSASLVHEITALGTSIGVPLRQPDPQLLSRRVGSAPARGRWAPRGSSTACGHNSAFGAALARVLGHRRFTTDVERVLFAFVANRAIDPVSKLAAAEWASNDVAIAGLDATDEDQAYRAMDLLIDADIDAEVQEAAFFAVDRAHRNSPVVLGGCRWWFGGAGRCGRGGRGGGSCRRRG